MNRSARLIYSLLRFLLSHILSNCIDFLSRQELSFKICPLAFKALKYSELGYLADLLNFQNVHVGMGLRYSDDPFWLEVPRATSEQCFSERALLYIAPCLLNRLPGSLKESDCIATFKSKLKTCMFVRAFDLSDRSVSEGYKVVMCTSMN